MTKGGDSGFRWFALRASADPFFLGRALAEYQAMHGIRERKLAELLKCSVDALARLALCRHPDDQEARFREDVKRISEFTSCSAAQLAQLLREVAAVASLRGEEKTSYSQGVLLVARDRRKRGNLQRKKRADKGERNE